jgi:hypothetical protein
MFPFTPHTTLRLSIRVQAVPIADFGCFEKTLGGFSENFKTT